MSEPRIVTPEEERLVLAYEVQRRLREKADRIAELEGHIATEPNRTRAAVVKALRNSVLAWTGTDTEVHSADPTVRFLLGEADAIENGADYA